jgi:hypothetical protein
MKNTKLLEKIRILHITTLLNLPENNQIILLPNFNYDRLHYRSLDSI